MSSASSSASTKGVRLRLEGAERRRLGEDIVTYRKVPAVILVTRLAARARKANVECRGEKKEKKKDPRCEREVTSLAEWSIGLFPKTATHCRGHYVSVTEQGRAFDDPSRKRTNPSTNKGEIPKRCDVIRQFRIGQLQLDAAQ